MPTISEVLGKLRVAATSEAFVKELNSFDALPSPASLQQIVQLLHENPAHRLSLLQTNALSQVVEFAKRSGPIQFTHLKRARITLDLIARVLLPSLVNQKGFGMCGPAAVAISSAKNDPVGYVNFAISLAESGAGTLGHRTVRPVESIRQYNPTDMAAADWIVLVSLRDDPTNLQNAFDAATYGGSTADELFKWMVDCGFQKVFLMSHVTLAAGVKAHPSGMLPPGATTGDKLKSLKTMADMSQRGWRIFLMAYMQLSKSIESFQKIGEIETLTKTAMTPTRTRESQLLATPNPGAVGTIWNVAKSYVGGSGGDTRHWTYVESLRLSGGSAVISCCNHGVRHPMVTVPMDGFLNKYLGFVAASDYA